LLDGLVHGHGDAATNGQVLARTQDGGNVVLDAGLREHARITPENLDDFHVHGDPAELPLSAVLFLPDSAKAATMTRARIEVAGRFQMLVPRDVVGELLAVVFAAKRLFDAVAAVLAAITVALTVLVLTLAARLRRSETEALHRLGCSRRTVALLHVGEVGAVFAAGAVLAGVLVAVAVAVVPDPMRWFGA
ncbi:MAG TPA: hypothetical protein VK081_13860, partial [Planctomycetota bacterium]|nr:hypothetical protein [Planctomycetota bacterium]